MLRTSRPCEVMGIPSLSRTWLTPGYLPEAVVNWIALMLVMMTIPNFSSWAIWWKNSVLEN